MKINVFKSVIVCLIAFSALGAQAQKKEIKADPRLYEVKKANYIEAAEQVSPQKVLWYNYYLNHSYEIMTTLPEEAVDCGSIYNLQKIDGTGTFNDPLIVFSDNTFNIMKYHIPQTLGKASYFTLGDSGKYLLIYSAEDFNSREKENAKSFGY